MAVLGGRAPEARARPAPLRARAAGRAQARRGGPAGHLPAAVPPGPRARVRRGGHPDRARHPGRPHRRHGRSGRRRGRPPGLRAPAARHRPARRCPGPPPACHARPAQTRRCWFSGSLQQLTAPARHPGLTRACLACLRFCTSGRARRAERCSGRRAHAGGARRAEVRYLGGLALHVQGNFVMQNLLHAAAKLRGAAALLRARGGTPDAELARLVGAGVGGTDAFGAPPASGLSAFPFSWRGGWQNSAWVRSPSGV